MFQISDFVAKMDISVRSRFVDFAHCRRAVDNALREGVNME